MEDLTIASFAYLRLPLLLAAVAFLMGAAGTFRATGQRAFLAIVADGGPVFSGRAHRHGGVRSLSLLAAAGGSVAPRARRES